ncbi:MAG: nicotinamide mononucleotide transporter [Tidjanibacter sp.]|nr:nicotinamide mononucleotide transporter [Tidjanibacter sp.]
MKKTATLRPFDIFIIVCTVGSALAYSLIKGQFELLGTVALLMGVTGTVLSAKRSIWNFLFGAVNVTLYAIIAYKTSNYGQAALNALYYLPMQFVGWWMWSHRKEEGEKSKVQSRSMRPVQILVAVLCTAAGTLLLGYLLSRYTDATQPLKDGFVTTVFIVGQILMTLTFWQQWFFWIAGNLLNVVLWAVVMAEGEMLGGLMLIKYSMYTLNSINGILIWHRAAKRIEKIASK